MEISDRFEQSRRFSEEAFGCPRATAGDSKPNLSQLPRCRTDHIIPNSPQFRLSPEHNNLSNSVLSSRIHPCPFNFQQFGVTISRRFGRPRNLISRFRYPKSFDFILCNDQPGSVILRRSLFGCLYTLSPQTLVDMSLTQLAIPKTWFFS